VRVRVLGHEGVFAREVAEAHVAARVAFAQASLSDSDSGSGVPVSPTALLPVVRSVVRDPPPPGRGAAPTPWAIEDYRMAFVDTVHARTLGEALAPLLLLRLSREDA
jgi:ATP-dependent Clp protease ATP-binding subunit ClpA/ATP-dependent Clp protease ATP-binding subunit ClpC